MTITEFLLARLAEDEESARRLRDRAQEHEAIIRDNQPKLLGRLVPGWYDWPAVQSMAAFVLAECEARREIVEWHSAIHDIDDERPCPTLRAVAMPFKEHPDYDERWRL